jgi:hypothetical protein
MASSTNSRIVAACFLTAFVAGCGDSRSRETADARTGAAAGEVAPPPPPPVVATETNVRVADITGNPTKYIGQTVTVEADLDEVLGPYAFELDEDSPVAGGIDNDLIVMWPRSLNLEALDNKWLNNKVRVTGRVQGVDIVALKRELDWDLTPKIEAKVKTRPVLIARTVQRVPGP